MKNTQQERIEKLEREINELKQMIQNMQTHQIHNHYHYPQQTYYPYNNPFYQQQNISLC